MTIWDALTIVGLIAGIVAIGVGIFAVFDLRREAAKLLEAVSGVRQEAAKLRDLNDIQLHALHAAGVIDLITDEHGNITGYRIRLQGSGGGRAGGEGRLTPGS